MRVGSGANWDRGILNPVNTQETNGRQIVPGEVGLVYTNSERSAETTPVLRNGHASAGTPQLWASDPYEFVSSSVRLESRGRGRMRKKCVFNIIVIAQPAHESSVLRI